MTKKPTKIAKNIKQTKQTLTRPKGQFENLNLNKKNLIMQFQ